jgi:hypothetical protein
MVKISIMLIYRIKGIVSKKRSGEVTYDPIAFSVVETNLIRLYELGFFIFGDNKQQVYLHFYLLNTKTECLVFVFVPKH